MLHWSNIFGHNDLFAAIDFSSDGDWAFWDKNMKSTKEKKPENFMIKMIIYYVRLTLPLEVRYRIQ